MKLPSASSTFAVLSLLVTGISPFSPQIYDSIYEENEAFVYEDKYYKNPLVEWERQLNSAMKKFDESVSHVDELPKSIVQSLIGELAKNKNVIAVWADFKPFDAKRVRVANISNQDLRDIRVHFIRCAGYDSHTTYPDSVASNEMPDDLRKRSDSVTIGYRRLDRQVGDSTNTASITFYGQDTSQCNPIVSATLENGKSASGKRVDDIDDFLWQKLKAKEKRESISNTAFGVGLLALGIYLVIQIRSIKLRLRQANL